MKGAGRTNIRKMSSFLGRWIVGLVVGMPRARVRLVLEAVVGTGAQTQKLRIGLVLKRMEW